MSVTVKLYHRFLKSLKNFGHDTNVLTVFRPSRSTRIASCPTGMAWWCTLLVYTSVTPYIMHDSRSRKGTGFVPKHGKKHAKAEIRHTLGTVKAHFRHSLGTVLARFRHKYSTLGTFLKTFVTQLAKKNKLGMNYKNNSDQTQYLSLIHI